MKTPLKEGDALIRAILREQWHLEVRSVRFIPFGNSAYSYRVETQQNRSHYLKIVDLRTSVEPRIAAHLNFSLPLLSASLPITPSRELWEAGSVEWFVIIRTDPPMHRRKRKGRLLMVQLPLLPDGTQG